MIAGTYSGKPRSSILYEKKPEWIYGNAATSLEYPLQVWDWVWPWQCVWVKSLIQRGPTTFYLRAILQKRDNLRAISFPIKFCIKQQIHNIEKWKREDKKLGECVIEIIITQ